MEVKALDRFLGCFRTLRNGSEQSKHFFKRKNDLNAKDCKLYTQTVYFTKEKESNGDETSKLYFLFYFSFSNNFDTYITLTVP
jgi:hypothetical protein